MIRSMLFLLVAAMAVTQPAQANLLVNPGFENPPTVFPNVEYAGATGWTSFNSVFTVDSSMLSPNSGAQALKLFSNPNSASGVYQQFPTLPGQLWDGGAFVLNDSLDPLAGVQFAAVNIEWIQADGFTQVPGGPPLSFVSNGDTTAATPQGQWILRPISGVAPPTAAFARFVLITGAFGGPGGGAPKYDDAFFAPRIPEPGSLALAGLAGIGLLVLRRRR